MSRCLTKLAKRPILGFVIHVFTIGEAKTNLSKLVALAERGERVELRRGREPVAQIVPLPSPGATRRKPGALAGQIEMAEDFDVWPEDIARDLGMTD